MMTLMNSPVNQERLAQAERALRELTEQSLRKGFFGAANLELSIQDGTIQHLKWRVERMVK